MVDKLYYGTNGYPGHKPISLCSEELSTEEYEYWNEYDCDGWICHLKNPHYEIVNVKGEDYTVYAIPYSVDDKRSGSHTNFFWKGRHTEEDILNYIKGDVFLRRQFNIR